MQVWADISRALTAGNCCCLVSVVTADGSTPREVGARMLVLPGGGFHSTIGGGAMEINAIEKALAMLAGATAKAELVKYALGPNLGQCCGGAVTLLFETFTPDQLSSVELLASAEATGALYCETEITAGGTARRIISSEPSTLGLAASNILHEDYSDHRQTLYIFGAGHVGKALMLPLATVGFKVVLVDNRLDMLPSHIPANFTTLHHAEPWQVVGDIEGGAYVLIMTHDHGIDYQILDAALTAGRFAYIGVIGSATKRARFISRLKKSGITEGVAESFICPIGIDGISSKVPADIAISVTADLLRRASKISSLNNS